MSYVHPLAGPHQPVLAVVHDHGVGLPEVPDAADEHPVGRAGQVGIVQADELHLLELAVQQAAAGAAPVEPHRPLHALDFPNAKDVVVGKRPGGVQVIHAGIHHADRRFADVADRADRQRHHAAEDRGLLRDQQRREGDPEDDPQVLPAVAAQHSLGNPGHRS